MQELDLPRGFFLAVARALLVMTIVFAGMSAWLLTQAPSDEVALAPALSFAFAATTRIYYKLAAG